MTPQTPIGWILFAIMWLAGPITGYVACNLIASAFDRRAVKRRDVVNLGIFGSLLTVSTLVLMFILAL